MRLKQLRYTFPLRLRSLFRRGRLEQELDEELLFHLELRIAQEMAAGKTPEEARNIALASMEGMEQQKEECRDARRVIFLDDLQRNVRYAVRALQRSPGFTAVTVMTLALGIGANSAIFSLVDTVLLKLLPVKAPEQLQFIERRSGHMSVTWNYPDYRAMRDHNTVFTGLASYGLGLQSLGVQTGEHSRAAAQLSHGLYVSGNYFEVLGVSPILGHAFTEADDRAPGVSPYVILSYAYWQSHFNRDPQAIGQKLAINGYPFTVIGVAPRGFTGTDMASKPDLFMPLMMFGEVMHIPFANWNNRHTWWMAAIGRLKTGTSFKQAEVELLAICKEQESAERRTLADPKLANPADPIVLAPAGHGFSWYTDELRKPLLILFVIVVLVLLIACANVANLMLARGGARQREIAIRLAVGASRWRVISQLLTESMLIAILGGVGGIFVSLAGIPVLLRFMPHPGYDVPGISASLDWRAVAFTATVCILTGLLFGITPAWQSTQPDLIPSLKEESPGSVGMGRFTLRKGLVILQLALSLPLLVGAMLFTRTLGNLRGLDTGFAKEDISIVSVDPTRYGYRGQRTRDFYDRLCARIAALPGVRSASFANITPLSGSSWNGHVTVEGAAKATKKDAVYFDAVAPRYFETLGTPVLLGGEFNEQDNPVVSLELPEHFNPEQKLPDAPGRHVAIVNETFAKHFFADHSAIGGHIDMGGPFQTKSLYEVIGVVKDAHYFSMRDAKEPMMFIPVWRHFVGQNELLIRTSGPITQLPALIRREIHALDPVIPLLNVHTLARDVDENILPERLVATLSGFFGILALLLSAVGLYGVVAYSVTRRTREIGIRMAIGAERKSVIWLVFRDVIVMVFIGAAIGTLAAFMATRAIAGILYGVNAKDPLSIAVAGFAIAVAAIVASLLPARRAARIDPTVALRYE